MRPHGKRKKLVPPDKNHINAHLPCSICGEEDLECLSIGFTRPDGTGVRYEESKEKLVKDPNGPGIYVVSLAARCTDGHVTFFTLGPCADCGVAEFGTTFNLDQANKHKASQGDCE